ncbi:MAG: hypothetical protein EHM40_08155 [Chloroflexi bacterium]|nr:MAG: hypothetical protein EHM40_08155 [Chloroflexota bacterium]
MPQETLNLIIGAAIAIVSSLLSQIAGNYFERKSDERKRKWELADREFNRRAQFLDKKLEEVQSHLANLVELSRKMNEYQIGIITVGAVSSYGNKAFTEINELAESMAKKVMNVFLLNDKELNDLHEKLLSLLREERQHINLIRNDIYAKETTKEPIDKEPLLQKASDYNKQAAQLLGDIYRRVDMISQKVP